MREVFVLMSLPEFPTIFQRLPNIAENVQRCSDNLIEHILVYGDKIEHLFEIFLGILNLMLLSIMC